MTAVAQKQKPFNMLTHERVKEWFRSITPASETSSSAVYFPGLDYLVYQSEDCAGVAHPVDSALSVLRHPDDHRIVGMRLYGFREIVRREVPHILGPRALFAAFLESCAVAIGKRFRLSRRPSVLRSA